MPNKKLPDIYADRLKTALQMLDLFRKSYSDVLVITEVITIQDVMTVALDTAKGPQKVGDVCSHDEINAILHAFEDNPGADPVLVAHYTLDEYRQTHPRNKE